LSVVNSTVSFSATSPSITLLVLPKSGAPANQPPVAVASATPISGYAPLVVNFNSAGSADPDGSITSFAWTFGDGATGAGATISHTYQNAGSYTAVLKVTDNQGATGTTSVAINVTTNPNIVNAPTSLTGKGGRGAATLSWHDNSNNETGFYIERAPAGSSSFVRVGTAAANATSFKDAVARGSYLYRVQAFNGTAASAYSNSVTVGVK
jgi:PKD repeat protein